MGSRERYPAWVKCPLCEDFLCTIHKGKHVADCSCSPIDEWPLDPYSMGSDSWLDPKTMEFTTEGSDEVSSYGHYGPDGSLPGSRARGMTEKVMKGFRTDQNNEILSESGVARREMDEVRSQTPKERAEFIRKRIKELNQAMAGAAKEAELDVLVSIDYRSADGNRYAVLDVSITAEI